MEMSSRAMSFTVSVTVTGSEVEFGMPTYWFTEEHQIQAPEAAAWTAGISGLHRHRAETRCRS
jgi:hypothetical protein